MLTDRYKTHVPAAIDTLPAPSDGSVPEHAGLWRSLRRVTTSGRYIPEIDGLRFIAILSVIFYHVGMVGWIDCGYCTSLDFGGGRIVSQLDRGVPLFFIISGLILGLPFANQRILRGTRVKLGSYLLRRVTRLEPPYIINLLIRFPMVHFAKAIPWLVVLAHLGVSLVYMHDVVYGTFPMVHIPSWSLEVEVQFYLLAPLLAVLFFSNRAWLRRLMLVTAILGFSVLRSYTPGPLQTRVHLSLLSFVQYFLIGFLIADLSLTLMPRMKSSWLWDVASLGALLAAFSISDEISYFALPVLFGVLVIGAFKGVLLRWFLRLPPISTIGGMCYSIYLTHSMIIQGCYWAMQKLHLINGHYWRDYSIGCLFSLPPILVFGTLFYVLIERPCMDKNWPHKLHRFLFHRGQAELPS